MANKIQDAFENVTADSDLKESTREFLAAQRRKKESAFLRPPFYKILAAACMITMLLCGAGGYAGYVWLLSPVSYVSIDVNPSVELALNRLDRVISTSAYNQQGEELLEELSLRGKKYTTAIDLIAQSNVLRKYLVSDEELVLTVAADSSRESTLKAGVEKSCRHIGHGSRSVSVDLEVAKQAHGNGLSVGKYSAYLQLSQYDDSVTIEECKEMSMAEIHCRIIEHEHGSGHGAETSDQEHEGEEEGADEAQDTKGHGHQHRRNHGNHE